jgi:hypothetical protein
LDVPPVSYYGEKQANFEKRLEDFHDRVYHARMVLAFLLVEQNFYLGVNLFVLDARVHVPLIVRRVFA